jgi:membrane dipeptidase
MGEREGTESSDPLDLTEAEERRAARLHRESPFVDGLVAGTYYLSDPDYNDRLSEAGVLAGNLTVGGPSFDFEGTVGDVAAVRRAVREHDEMYHLVETVDDIAAAATTERTGIILGFQGANWMGNDLDRVRSMYELGVRIVDPTYNRGNTLGDGCCERRDAGLTALGQEMVSLCNELGIVLDTAHCNDSTTGDVIERSDDPVIQSHIGCRAIANAQGRAKTDAQLGAVAAGGGVNCITPFPPVIKRDPETHRVLQATIHDVLDHIDHAVEVGGAESVAFGSDMSDRTLDAGSIHQGSNLATWRTTHPEVYGAGSTERMDPYPVGLSRLTEIENLARGLVARGYDDDAIEGILGGNLLRVFEDVWSETADTWSDIEYK